MLRSVSEMQDNSYIRQWIWNKRVIVTDDPQHSIFFFYFLDGGKLQMIAYMFHKLQVYKIFRAHSWWI